MAYTLGNALLDIADVHRKLTGQVWDPATDTYGPPTAASAQAATDAINAIVASFVGLLPSPIPLGILGNISSAQVSSLATGVVAAMKPYAVATTKV